jgi:[acyl-carrier-protein] S-malonyltransferase
MIAIVCPGQGSQTPGFFSPWLENSAFAEAISEMQEASGVDLVSHGTLSDADTIRDTAIAQPLIVAAGVATVAALKAAGAKLENVAGYAGHSVGEVTAAVAAGVFTSATGIQFVTKRATEMAKAAALESTSMAAVLGGEQAVVEARLAELDLQPANYNGSGQIVAAGSASAIAALQAEGPAGARVIPLQVAGAFHTRYMQPAVAALADYSETLVVNDPAARLWTNSNGQTVSSGAAYLDLLVKQVSNPVRWDLCMESMLAAGISKIIEVVPAGTLSGLAKRAMPGIEIVAVKTPENLEAALSLINND